MSAIDAYKHKVLGFIECPSMLDFIENNKTRRIAVYELLENIPSNEKNFDGKVGDVLVGGGSGEAQTLRISIPIAFKFFTQEDEEFPNFESLDEICKTFWTPTKSYIYCEGFSKLGWTINENIEMWLAGNVCKLLISKFERFSIYKTDKLDLSTSLTLSVT